jgi:hypothetical protein
MQQAAPEQPVARHVRMSVEALNEMVTMVQELPWRQAQPILNCLTQHARVVADEPPKAVIVPDVPEAPLDSVKEEA